MFNIYSSLNKFQPFQALLITAILLELIFRVGHLRIKTFCTVDFTFNFLFPACHKNIEVILCLKFSSYPESHWAFNILYQKLSLNYSYDTI